MLGLDLRMNLVGGRGCVVVVTVVVQGTVTEIRPFA